MHCFLGREGRQSTWGILIDNAMIMMVIMRWTTQKKFGGTKIMMLGPVRMQFIYMNGLFYTIQYFPNIQPPKTKILELE